MAKKRIGIVGGMGPMATVELFRMIVENTKSDSDQDHIRILIDNNPQVPDRTQAILTGSRAPVRCIQKSAEGLISLGAQMILIPCNTSHYFFREIQEGLDVEVVNMIDETARTLQERGLRKVGLLATTGTVRGWIYHRYFAERGLDVVQPGKEDQEAVMDFIYKGVKAGDYGFDPSKFTAAAGRLLDRGAQTLVLGCTELPVGIRMYGLQMDCTDSLEVLARSAIVKAGYELRK